MQNKISGEAAFQLYRQRITAARVCPNTFAELILPNQDDPRRNIEQAPFHERIHSFLNRYNYLIIELPREHGKTEQIIARVVWELGRRPWLRIIIVCANNAEAKKRIAAIGQYLTMKTTKVVFPHLMPAHKGQWSANSLFVQRFTPTAVEAIAKGDASPMELYRSGEVIISKDPSVEARGILGSGTGSRGDLIVYDDPCDFANTIGRPALRSAVISAYADNWEQIVTKSGGRQWYVGTPWAEDDLLAHLKSIAYPAGSDKANEASPSDWIHYGAPTGRGPKYGEPECLWPERISVQVLDSAYRKIGSAAYSRAYLLKAVSDKDRLFTESALKRIEPVDSSIIKYNPDGYPLWRTFGGLDLAVSTKDSADNRVLTTAILNPETGERILLGQRVGKWGPTECMDNVIEEYLKWNHSVIRVENNAMQEAARQWIEERVRQRIREGTLDGSVYIATEPHTTGATNKWDEAIGLPALAAEIEAGRWRVILPPDHEGGNFCHCWYCELLTELRGFRINGTTLAPHDDRVFSFWFVRECISQNTFSGHTRLAGEDSRQVKFPQNGSRRSVKTHLTRW